VKNAVGEKENNGSSVTHAGWRRIRGFCKFSTLAIGAILPPCRVVTGRHTQGNDKARYRCRSSLAVPTAKLLLPKGISGVMASRRDR